MVRILCQGGKPDTGKFHSCYIGMNVCGSAYENGCVVDGMCATAIISFPIYQCTIHSSFFTLIFANLPSL